MRNLFKFYFIVSSLLMFFSSSVFAEKSHSMKVGEKFFAGITNVSTGFVEIPKTIYITGKENGAAYGATAGFVTGLGHMLGRTMFGVLDLMTFMIPTQPLVHPEYIWNNFGQETSYTTNWQMRR